MATKTKAVVKPTKNVKTPNKAASAKVAVAAKSAKKPEKKVIPAKAPAKTPAKAPSKAPVKVAVKAAPVKKTPVAVKKATVKPVKPAPKSAPVKKSEPMKKANTTKDQKKDGKTNTKSTPVKKIVEAKKSTPVKKVEPVKKAALVKKVEPAKKPAPVKAPAAKPVKPVPKAVVKTAPAPAPKAAPKPVSAKPVKKESSGSKKVVSVKPVTPVVLVKPMATPAARPIEKKPTVVIAHRRMENKSKHIEESASELPYQPEVYRSLLDEPPPPPVTVYRYSDEELTEFRELISNRLEAARKELIYLQGLITRKDEAGTEDTENRYMNMEDGSGAMEREQLAQLASRQIQFINHLEKALIRIENKTYGICRVTGKLIEKARLRAVPHATLSIEAKKMMNTKQN